MKNFTLLLAIALTSTISWSQVIFQSDFENWTAGDPDGWMGDKTSIASANVTQVNTGAAFGSNVCRLEETTATHKRFTTENLSVTNGETYQISIWVKGEGEIRTNLHNGSAYQTYSPYQSINSGSNIQVVQNFVASNSSTDAQFIISVMNTVAPNHLEIDSVGIEQVVVGPPSTVSIYDIQYTVAGGTGPSPYATQVVNTGGIVMTAPFTSDGSTYFFIQDNVGAWNGIMVESSENVVPGDSITFTGIVQENFGFTIITGLTNFAVVNQGNTLYAAESIDTDDVNSEPFESVLVVATSAFCTDPNTGFGQFEIDDSSGPCLVGNLMHAYTTQQLNDEYNMTGIVYYSYSEFKLCPRFAADVVLANAPVPTTTSIYAIQFTTDASGDSDFKNQVVTTSGTVCAVRPGGGANNPQGFYIQDGDGPWSGVFVFNSTISVQEGDSIELTGTVKEFFGQTEIDNVSSHTIHSSGNAVLTTIVTTSQVNDEDYEGVLVQVIGANCTDPNAGFGQFVVNDNTGTCLVDDDIYAYPNPQLNVAYDITGAIRFSFGEAKMEPRRASDVTVNTNSNIINYDKEVLSVYPNPTSGNLNITSSGIYTIVDINGKEVMTGSSNATAIDVSSLNQGMYMIQLQLEDRVLTTRFIKE